MGQGQVPRNHSALLDGCLSFHNMEMPGRLYIFQQWYSSAFARILTQTESFFTGLGFRPEGILQDLAGGEPRPWTLDTTRKVRSSFQSYTRRLLLPPGVSQAYMQNRMSILLQKRIGSAGPGLLRRVTIRLRRLRALGPPRIWAANIRTIWNGWCTGRRFQNSRRRKPSGAAYWAV